MGDRMSPKQGLDDVELVRRSRGGDRDAFGQLVRRYERAAHVAAISCLGHDHDAMDVVQEAFVAAYCKLGQLRDGERFGGWLRTIVRRRALQWIRERAGRGACASLRDADAGLAGASARRHDRDRTRTDVLAAVAGLPEKFREVVLLHYIERWRYRRIATFMGLPVSTIKGRLQMARHKLKEHLSPIQEGAATMKQDEDSSPTETKVRESIYKIATEDVHEVIPMGDSENVVLFCGVIGDVEICQTEGNDVVLNGTKASLGVTPEAARASAAGIRILSDQVTDWVASGPHDGELFAGTNTDEQGNPTAVIDRAKDRGKYLTRGLAEGKWAFGAPDPPYGDVGRTHGEAASSVREMMRNATRITVVREKMEDVVLPKDVWTPDLERVFSSNYGNDKVRHGPVGRVSLTVGVPVGRGVVLVWAWPFGGVRISDLRSSIAVVGATDVEVCDVVGDVCLLDSVAREARNIDGRFVQSFHGIGPGNSDNYATKQCVRHEFGLSTSLRDITGLTWVDVAKIKVEAAGLEGDVCIRNRFGATCFHKATHRTGTRARLETDSGKVTVCLAEKLLGEVAVTATSLHGSIDFEGLRDLGALHLRNDMYAMMVSTIFCPGSGIVPAEVLEADICVIAHDGDVTIEKMV